MSKHTATVSYTATVGVANKQVYTGKIGISRNLLKKEPAAVLVTEFVCRQHHLNPLNTIKVTNCKIQEE